MAQKSIRYSSITFALFWTAVGRSRAIFISKFAIMRILCNSNLCHPVLPQSDALQTYGREKRKQKYNWLESEVARLSEALAQQERRKAELLAEIQDLQARHAVQAPHNTTLLPQLQEVGLLLPVHCLFGSV